jgi:hypothetical protein
MKESAMHAHRSRALFITMLLAYAGQAATQDAEAWIHSLKNMSQAQGQTLAGIGRIRQTHDDRLAATHGR